MTPLFLKAFLALVACQSCSTMQLTRTIVETSNQAAVALLGACGPLPPCETYEYAIDPGFVPGSPPRWCIARKEERHPSCDREALEGAVRTTGIIVDALGLWWDACECSDIDHV